MLDALIPAPRKLETRSVDLAASPAIVWEYVRHADLDDSRLVRALFALRTLPSRCGATSTAASPAMKFRIDALRSTPEQPGFQLLTEAPPHELVVGAIGKVWQPDIQFVHVSDAAAFAKWSEPGWVKVAWALRLDALGSAFTRLHFELRVDATDEESWRKFARYWRLIGPGSHFVRHAILGGLRRRFGDPNCNDREEELSFASDALLSDASAQITRSITIQAPPAAIWPWLVQLGCRRGGFYALDWLDNGGSPSARELHAEWQRLAVGDVVAATPEGTDGFEVLRICPNESLVLGSSFDVDANCQRSFDAPRPRRYWQVTWAFTLEPLAANTTRLHVRARAAFSPSERLRVAWIRPVHALMQGSQLRHLAARAERRLARDSFRDIAAGVGGAAVITVAWLTPFLRPARNHWGLSAEEAQLRRSGDELVPEPHWGFTHAVEVEAPAAQVWPWLAQLGADRAGFYSYQWLENVAGCEVNNAETIHPEWAHAVGDELVLHPKIPPLRVVSVVPESHFVAFAPADEQARAEGRPWAAASWAFFVEPLGPTRCRVLSRFRCAYSDDLPTQLAQGPLFLEPVSFAMDRRMLLGLRDRAERAQREAQLLGCTSSEMGLDNEQPKGCT